MPELPEVETVKSSIIPYIIGQKIIDIDIKCVKLRYPLPPTLSTLTLNQDIVHVDRRAKYLLLKLSNGYNIIIHLGMSGKLQLKPHKYDYIKHDHIIFKPSNSSLVFNDARRFGMVDIIHNTDILEHRYFANLGLEPLDDDFTGTYLQQTLKCRSAPIKLAIMDNAVVVGIGNIYANESLYKAGIHPLKKVNSITSAQFEQLAKAIKDTLVLAISAGGTTLKDYVNAVGATGYFQHHFKIYNKINQACTRCATIIQRMKLGGRVTYYCPRCQEQ